MSHTRVKTTYEAQGCYASTEVIELYCDHNHCQDCVTFYNADGGVASMLFCEWVGNDKWDAMNRLWFPFKGEWGKELKDGVEYYHGEPWKENEQQ